jgi:hypothetical protein
MLSGRYRAVRDSVGSHHGSRIDSETPAIPTVGRREEMEDKAGLRTAARGLTRAQVAELLGVPESEVGRMDGRLLRPVRTGDRRWLYDLGEIRALLDRSSGPSGTRPVVSGETTAQVFELFEGGKTLAQAVIATQQTADTIMHLRAQYDRMAGTMVLSSETVSQLRKAIGREFRPETLVEVVQSELHRMFQEGREDATELGFVRDWKTGEMKPIPRAPLAKAGAPMVYGHAVPTAVTPERAASATDGAPGGQPAQETSPAQPGVGDEDLRADLTAGAERRRAG